MSYEQRIGDHRCICDFSGFQVWRSECVKTWNGLIVHRRFVGEEANRHPQDRVVVRPEHPAVRDARPEAADTFLAVNEVTPGSL